MLPKNWFMEKLDDNINTDAKLQQRIQENYEILKKLLLNFSSPYLEIDSKIFRKHFLKIVMKNKIHPQEEKELYVQLDGDTWEIDSITKRIKDYIMLTALEFSNLLVGKFKDEISKETDIRVII